MSHARDLAVLLMAAALAVGCSGDKTEPTETSPLGDARPAVKLVLYLHVDGTVTRKPGPGEPLTTEDLRKSLTEAVERQPAKGPDAVDAIADSVVISTEPAVRIVADPDATFGVLDQLLTTYADCKGERFVLQSTSGGPEYNLSLPPSRAGASPDYVPSSLPPLRVRIGADQDGLMNNIRVSQQHQSDFGALRGQLINILGPERGPGSIQESLRLELDCEAGLKLEYLFTALEAVTGFDGPDGKRVVLIEQPWLVTKSGRLIDVAEIEVPQKFAWKEDIDAVDVEIDDLIDTPDPTDLGELDDLFDADSPYVVRGSSGVGVSSGAVATIERLTFEILQSLKERPTLVVWIFDQSPSLLAHSNAARDRFRRIYEELGVVKAAGHPSFTKHDDKPLLSSVIAFGHQVTLRTKQPTDDVDEIMAAVKGIEPDDSGEEMVFTAIYQAASRYADFGQPDVPGGPPKRNVMLIVLTDEVGDDTDKLEPTIQTCQKLAMPVYVLGVPSVFGRRESLVKWVDPDPTLDQTPQWGRVNQGPESLVSERIRLPFSGFNEDEEPLDSGFGPFHLTRLCFETGGVYFAVHPNRTLDGPISKKETAAYAAHIRRFFDPLVMRKYKPDYVSNQEYKRRLDAYPTRSALVKAAHTSWEVDLAEPRTRFVRTTEDRLSTDFQSAVEQTEKVALVVETVYQVLSNAEPDRDRESMPRWQAGYDLAMGQALAAKARCDGYRRLLADMAKGDVVKDARNNHYEIIPALEMADDPQLVELAERSKSYLERVIAEHPDTPWAFVASRELARGMGWEVRARHVE